MQLNPIENLTTGKMLNGHKTQDSTHGIYRFIIKDALSNVEPGQLLDYHGKVLLVQQLHPHLKKGLFYVHTTVLLRTATITRHSKVKSAFGRELEQLHEVGHRVSLAASKPPQGANTDS